jgi:hypothetical protein
MLETLFELTRNPGSYQVGSLEITIIREVGESLYDICHS